MNGYILTPSAPIDDLTSPEARQQATLLLYEQFDREYRLSSDEENAWGKGGNDCFSAVLDIVDNVPIRVKAGCQGTLSVIGTSYGNWEKVGEVNPYYMREVKVFKECSDCKIIVPRIDWQQTNETDAKS